MKKQLIGKSNSVVKELRRQIKSNSNKDLFIIEDISIIEIALKNNLKIDQVFYCTEKLHNEDTIKILNRLKNKCSNIFSVSESTFDLLAQKNNAPGIIITLRDIFANKKEIDFNDFNRVLITDKLEIPGNLGTIYRTADATNFDLIINVDLVTSINHPKCIKSSRGMVFNIPTLNCSYEYAQQLLVNNNIKPLLGEPAVGENCFSYKFEKKVVLVVGNERFGINSLWYENPHKKIYIPMSGYMNSLNLSVASSILMYQAVKGDFVKEEVE